MQTNEQLLSAIENYLAQTEFPAEPELLYAPIGYSLAGGGKRLRPMLLTLSCGIFSDDVKQALPAAAAVEVFHNFTLLHDDIMDNAAVRRGKPSVHAKWGQNVATRISTGMLNSVLADATARVQPPTDKGRRLKIYYMTQVGIRPPHFVCFCNDARLFHFSYQRYLENQIRATFGLEGTPVRLTIRQKGEKEE